MLLEEKLNALFESWGYHRFRLSKFEAYDFYAENRDFLKSSQLITFTDLDGALRALKPDITLSILKNSGGFDKLYYHENVYRPKDGHYREIPQAGVECIGAISLYEEAEMLALAAHALALLSQDYILRISDLGLLDALLGQAALSPRLRRELLRDLSEKNSSAIDKKQAAGLLPEHFAARLRALTALYCPLSETLPEVLLRDCAPERLPALRQLQSLLSVFGIAERVYLDFSLINSMDYYNGILFQGAVPEIPFPVLSGGRYDRLSQKMGKDTGAIGFAVYMDLALNYLPAERKQEETLLLSYTEEDAAERLAAAAGALRARGFSVRTVPHASLSAARRFPACRVLSIAEAENL